VAVLFLMLFLAVAELLKCAANKDNSGDQESRLWEGNERSAPLARRACDCAAAHEFQYPNDRLELREQ
jgi:hypothetical protein